jgi:hypothetical protein
VLNISVLDQRHSLLAQTNRCLERTSAFVALRIETKEISASEGRRLSPQRLCGSVERRCRKASFCLAPQSETRSTEVLRVCWDDGNSRRSPIRKSQERLQIGLGRQEIWRATDAGALRTFEPDAVRSRSPDGNRIGRRLTRCRIYGYRRTLITRERAGNCPTRSR